MLFEDDVDPGREAKLEHTKRIQEIEWAIEPTKRDRLVSKPNGKADSAGSR